MRRLILATLILTAGCATTPAPVAVTRFAARPDVPRGSVAAAPGAISLEQKNYDFAVERALVSAGFQPLTDGQPRYIFTSEVTRDSRDAAPRRSPVTIGIGGGTGGYGGGFGLGASFGLGSTRSRNAVVTRLSVQLRDRITNAVVWEGRAQTSAADDSPSAQPSAAVERLAQALFRDFPGESGRTISVP